MTDKSAQESGLMVLGRPVFLIPLLKKMRIAILVLLFALHTRATGNQPVDILNSFAGKPAGKLFVRPKMAKLHFNCNGVLGHIYVHKGKRFKKGQLLASLEYEDVNAPTINAAIYRNKAREAYVALRASDEMKQPARPPKLLKKPPGSAEVNHEKCIAACQCYYLRADHNGSVVKEALKEGDLVSAGETILIVR